ncbi:MAG: COR domain-containing protein, partial [Chitinophagales bacterium]
LSSLSQLTTLDLRYNSLSDISVLSSLSQLTTLDLSANSLSDISPLYGLKQLQRLDLKKNQIEVFSEDLLHLELPIVLKEYPSGKYINLYENPLKDPSIEVVEGGNKLIRNYFERKKKEDFDYLYEMKLLLLGKAEAGKSSIADALMNPDYSFHNKKSTHAFQVLHWDIPRADFEAVHCDLKEHPELQHFRLNIWDFGGQDLYHTTHKFFLTRHSLYVIVNDARTESEQQGDLRYQDLYYWLHFTKILGDNSPTIVLLNKCDLPHQSLPIEQYKELFPNIVANLEVSCTDDKRAATFAPLHRVIRQTLTNSKLLPEVGTPLPISWIKVRGELGKLADKKPYMALGDYLDLCAEKFELSEEDASFILRYFHQLGVVLHFRKDAILKETVFLNHHWVVQGVYGILQEQAVIDNHGRFDDSDIEKIWQGDYAKKRDQLLQLMKSKVFRICFPLPKGGYLAPHLLSKKAPDYEWNPQTIPLQFEFHYPFMPKGILSQFIVEEHTLISAQTYWRHGVLLEYEGNRALVEEEFLKGKIRIEVVGNDPKKLLEIIRKSLNTIHADFHKLKVEEQIPCCCAYCKNSSDPFFHNYQILQRRRQGSGVSQCDYSDSLVDVRELLRPFAVHGKDLHPGRNHRDDGNVLRSFFRDKAFSLKQKQAELQSAIVEKMAIKETCNQEAQTAAQEFRNKRYRVLLGINILVFIFWSCLIYKFGFDIMEQFTFLAAILFIIGQVGVNMYLGKNWNVEGAIKERYKKECERLYQERKVNATELEKMQKQLEQIEMELVRLEV